MKTTTLAKLARSNFPNWDNLLEGLNKTKADDEALPYAKILEICGLRDAILATRTEADYKWIRELAIKYAQHIHSLMTDKRSVMALDVAQRYLMGQASDDEVKEARKQARVVADTVCYRNHPVWRYKYFAAETSAIAMSVVSSRDPAFITASVSGCALCAVSERYWRNENRELEWQTQEFLRLVA